jgi:outer membrane receptor protein involved in Fe transport
MRSGENRDSSIRWLSRSALLPAPATPSRIGLAVAAALAGAGAWDGAQALDAAPAADASATGGLAEIVITARKRTENLQDVPLSVDVLTSKDVQNLGIVEFSDYATKVPSISFISIGPGTQTFFMRGVSDGSNPNYANTSATGFFLDDSSLSWFGAEPDLHLYDLQRIEVLNGPQGTTFGASSMAGAIRYITNKPDVNAFSGGADFEGGQIQSAQQNWTYEGFVNIPLIEGTLGLRASAFSASHGGFVANQLTTRTWFNGTTSDNSQWARKGYNREHEEGGRVALKWMLNDKWSALFSYDYQRMSSDGAWDEDPTLAPLTVERFGPQALSNQAKIGQFHLDGDLGIADLVFASTYWDLPTRRWDEYSQYMENFAPSYTPFYPTGAPAGSQEGFTCVNDPAYGGVPFTGCSPPLQYYEYHTNPERWSDELRLASKPGGSFHWLAGLYWEKTRDKNSGSTYFMPGLNTSGAAFTYENTYYATTGSSLPPGVWYAYTTRSDYLQTTEFADISYDLTGKLNVEAGTVHFHSDAKYYSPYGQFAYNAVSPSLSQSSSHKWDSKLGMNYKVTDRVMLYADWAQGFRDGGSNSGDPPGCYANGVPPDYIPDTLSSYEIGWKTTSLNGHLLWDGATYLMDWKDYQTIIYDVNICPSASFYANVGQARIYGAESNVDYKVDENWSLQAAASYTDSHMISTHYPTFEAEVGERLPYVPYFSYSANLRYEHPLSARMNGYAQFDIAHKGDMWDDLHVAGSNGFPRILQPEYSIMNVRFGLTPAGSARWLAELYVKNLANKNAILYTNTGNFDLRQTVNQPRVYGVRLSYRFGKGAGAE